MHASLQLSLTMFSRNQRHSQAAILCSTSHPATRHKLFRQTGGLEVERPHVAISGQSSNHQKCAVVAYVLELEHGDTRPRIACLNPRGYCLLEILLRLSRKYLDRGCRCKCVPPAELSGRTQTTRRESKQRRENQPAEHIWHNDLDNLRQSRLRSSLS